MPEKTNKYQVGGQAVIEGVMMRGKHFWSLAVRRPDKTISSRVFKNSSITLSGSSEKKCIDVPKSGVFGIFGGTEEKCFNYDVPAQTIIDLLLYGSQEWEE